MSELGDKITVGRNVSSMHKTNEMVPRAIAYP